MIRIANLLKPEHFTVFSIAPSVVGTREQFESMGVDYDAFVKQIQSAPGSSGVKSPEEGATILLDSIHRMRPEDSGRVVGMWGSEDKWM